MVKINKEKNIINDDMALERYLRKNEQEEKEQHIQYLLELVRNNPEITEEMIRPDLRKYFGIVKREYKKEIFSSEHKRRR